MCQHSGSSRVRQFQTERPLRSWNVRRTKCEGDCLGPSSPIWKHCASERARVLTQSYSHAPLKRRAQGLMIGEAACSGRRLQPLTRRGVCEQAPGAGAEHSERHGRTGPHVVTFKLTNGSSRVRRFMTDRLTQVLDRERARRAKAIARFQDRMSGRTTPQRALGF